MKTSLSKTQTASLNVFILSCLNFKQSCLFLLLDIISLKIVEKCGNNFQNEDTFIYTVHYYLMCACLLQI